MRGRVELSVPGLTERTVIGTFHSFCAQVLRRHGSQLESGRISEFTTRIRTVRNCFATHSYKRRRAESR